MSSVRPRSVSVVFNWCSVTLLEGSSVINIFSRVGIQPYCFIGLTCFSCLRRSSVCKSREVKPRSMNKDTYIDATVYQVLTYVFVSPAGVCLCRNVFVSVPYATRVPAVLIDVPRCLRQAIRS